MAVALAVGLMAIFFRNADFGKVWTAITLARLDLVLLSVALTGSSYVIRAERWQYLLEPLGRTHFGPVFRATVIGFAASTILPARVGEVIRPYILAKREGFNPTSAFATIVVERVLDLVGVLTLLAVYLLWLDPGMEARDSAVFRAIRVGGLTMAPIAVAALLVMFFLGGHPDTLHAWLLKAERVLPSRMAHAVARLAQTFAAGFAVVRRPRRLLAALAWSLVLWVAIGVGVWAIARAFQIDMPLTGAWLMLAPLVVGVAVPTPGGVGGFHEAFRIGATSFFGADNDAAVAAAIVLHAVSFGPVVVAGLWFAVQDGLKLGGLQQIAARGDLT
ncbi:MAG: lysylphosphatidylglycerol synthase transmembrane domain-containing protein [Vicinamibacterales bacterium]